MRQKLNTLAFGIRILWGITAGYAALTLLDQYVLDPEVYADKGYYLPSTIFMALYLTIFLLYMGTRQLKKMTVKPQA